MTNLPQSGATSRTLRPAHEDTCGLHAETRGFVRCRAIATSPSVPSAASAWQTVSNQANYGRPIHGNQPRDRTTMVAVAVGLGVDVGVMVTVGATVGGRGVGRDSQPAAGRW